MRVFKVALFVTLFTAVPLLAQITGQLDGTLTRGEKKTFTADIQVPSQGITGPLTVTVNSGSVTLGKTTITGPFTCKETQHVNTCSGNVSLTAGQKLTLSQELTLPPDAWYLYDYWTIQLIANFLSGYNAKTGTITNSNPAPRVVLSSPPRGLVFPLGGSDTDSMRFRNVGSAPSSVSLRVDTPDGATFTLDPPSFLLAPGASQRVDILARDTLLRPGIAKVLFTVTGEGVVDPSILYRVRIDDRPGGVPLPEPAANLFESSTLLGDPNPKVSIPFTNKGQGALKPLITSDVPWIVPSDDVITIQPGETKNVDVTIDLSKQAQILAENGGFGALWGFVTLRYLLPASGKGGMAVAPHANPPGTASKSTTIVSTVKATVVDSAIPPLSEVHSQLFLAGVGHVVGSVGLFISDLAVYPQVARSQASERFRSLSDIDFYYSPLGGGTAKKASLASLANPNVAAFGDLVGTVYGATQQVGSLQIRAPGFLADSGVGVNANVFNVSGSAGTYGTTIPVFKFSKFDCTQDLTKKLYIPGLRKDAAGHTNFYVQETCGSAAKVKLDFHDAGGAKIGSTSVDLAPFTATQLGQATLPEGAVSTVVSHDAGSAGGFVAYATPVDRASGDTWAQVDWPNLRRYQANVPVVIPVAGALPGANNTYFRTDVSIMNVGTTSGSGTLRFYNRDGSVLDRTITLNPLQTGTYVDVTTTLFGVTTPHVGYMVFTPASGGRFSITSRNYSTPAGSNATFGTAVPIVSVSSALRPSELKRIGGVDDASPEAISVQQPATFRSNFGLIETAGQAATVRVTVMYRSSSSLTSTMTGASATFELAPRQFLLTNLANAIFGADRANVGDLRNVMVEFEVIGGTGNVLPFITSIDNGTGDSTFRVE